MPGRPGWRVLLWVGLAYGVGMSGYVAWRAERSTDFRDFWQSARTFGQAEARSAPESPGARGGARFEGAHNYLPFFPIFMAPWGLLPLRVAIVVFTWLSLACFGLTLVLMEALVYGEPASRPRPPTLAALALSLPYAHACLAVGNLGLLLLFLVVAGWFLVQRSAALLGGAALGLAVLIKLLPGVLLALLAVQRRWKPLAAAAAVLVVMGAGLPLGALGWDGFVAQHEEFHRTASAHRASEVIRSERPVKAKYNNNALPIVLRRLLTPVNANPSPDPEQRPVYVNVADLPPSAVLVIYYALASGVLTLGIAAALRSCTAADTTDASAGLLGAGCCLMLLLSPLLWTHYLPLAYPALFMLAATALQRSAVPGRRAAQVALVAWGVAAVLLIWPAARAAGAQIAGVAVVWGVLTSRQLAAARAA